MNNQAQGRVLHVPAGDGKSMWVAQASENGSHTQRGGSRLKRLLIGAPALVLLLTEMIPLTSRVHAASLPDGERILRQNVLEPVFDDTTGNVTFVMTPINAPLHAKPASWAPFYVPVYPVGASVGTLQCAHLPADNCPDHGPQIAGAAASIVPASMTTASWVTTT